MKRVAFAISLLFLLGLAACSGDDDPTKPPVPVTHETKADFWNLLVADGSTDTRLDFFRDSDGSIATNIVPFGGSTKNKIDLTAASSSVVLGYTLSNPGATPLQSSQAYTLTENRRDRFVVCGILGSVDPDVAPRMVQLDSLAAQSRATSRCAPSTRWPATRSMWTSMSTDRSSPVWASAKPPHPSPSPQGRQTRTPWWSSPPVKCPAAATISTLLAVARCSVPERAAN